MHLCDQEQKRKIAGENPCHLLDGILARQPEAFLFFRNLESALNDLEHRLQESAYLRRM